MATSKPLSSNPIRNNGATVLHAGTTDGENVTNSVTLATNGFQSEQGPVIAVKPSESGNVGGFKPISGGTFRQAQPMTDGVYIGYRYNNVSIAGVSSTLLKGGASDYRRVPFHTARQYEALGITDISAFTGTPTYNTGKQGSGVPLVNPIGGANVTIEPMPTDAVPGELAYMVTGATPTQDDYEKRTSN